MNRIERLWCGNKKSVSFIWGEKITIIKAFSQGDYTPNIKMSSYLARQLYRALVQHGAQKIL